MSPEIPLTVASSLVSSADVGDPEASRTVYLTVVGLAVVAVALVAVGVWLIRQTRVDPELLAPLEEIDSRRWRRTDPVGRRRLLDEVRPNGATPQIPTPDRPLLDTEFGVASQRALDFDDLAGDGLPDPDPVESDDDESGDEESDAQPSAARASEPSDAGRSGREPLLGSPDGMDDSGGEDDIDDAGDADDSGGVDQVDDMDDCGEAGAADEGDDSDGVGSEEAAVGGDGDGHDDGGEDDGDDGDDADGDDDDDDTGDVEEPDLVGEGASLVDAAGPGSWPPPRIPGEGLLGRAVSAEEPPMGDG